MLFTMIIAANISTAIEQEPKEYQHKDYVTNIYKAECYMCSDDGDTLRRRSGLSLPNVENDRCKIAAVVFASGQIVQRMEKLVYNCSKLRKYNFCTVTGS